jgi:hypothetical protein
MVADSSSGGGDGAGVSGSSRGGAVVVADPSSGGGGAGVSGSSRGGAVVVADPSSGGANDAGVSIMSPLDGFPL